MSAHSDVNRNIDSQTGGGQLGASTADFAEGHMIVEPFDEDDGRPGSGAAADAAAQPTARRTRPIDDADTEGHIRARE